MSNEIQNYAKMLNMRQKYQDAGKPCPPNLASQIGIAEATAQRVFSPEQLYHVGQQVDQLRANYTHDEVQVQDAKDFQVERARENKAFDKATAGLAGDGKSMSPNQVAQAINNDGKFTRKAKPQFDELHHERVCQKKFGCSLNDFYERHDQIQSAELKDPRVAKILREKWSITPAMQRSYQKDGFKVAWEQNEAKNHKQEDEEVNLGANEIKADIMAAMSSEEHQMEVYDEPISGKLLNEDSLTGDIANAFHQHEEKEIHEAAGIDYEIDVDEENGEIRGYSHG